MNEEDWLNGTDPEKGDGVPSRERQREEVEIVCLCLLRQCPIAVTVTSFRSTSAAGTTSKSQQNAEQTLSYFSTPLSCPRALQKGGNNHDPRWFFSRGDAQQSK